MFEKKPGTLSLEQFVLNKKLDILGNEVKDVSDLKLKREEHNPFPKRRVLVGSKTFRGEHRGDSGEMMSQGINGKNSRPRMSLNRNFCKSYLDRFDNMKYAIEGHKAEVKKEDDASEFKDFMNTSKIGFRINSSVMQNSCELQKNRADRFSVSSNMGKSNSNSKVFDAGQIAVSKVPCHNKTHSLGFYNMNIDVPGE